MCVSHICSPSRKIEPGMKQTGSTLRADTNHFYNCLQQERKHELNSSVVDGFGGETRMNCQQDGFFSYPGICCRSLRSGCPAQSPRICRHSLQVGAHCAMQLGAGPASVEENVSGVARRRAHSFKGNVLQPLHLPQLEEDRSKEPLEAPMSLLSWSKPL